MKLINILPNGVDNSVQHLRANIQQNASPQHTVECLHLPSPGMRNGSSKPRYTKLLITIFVIRSKAVPASLSK